MAKILIVEDDPELGPIIVSQLKDQKYTVEHVVSAEDAMSLLSYSAFDLVIMDWELPGMSGRELVKKIRADANAVPILMLTGRSHISDKELGFESGADDYLTKPFDLRELAVRIKALLRRPVQLGSEIMTYKDLVLDPADVKLTKGDREIRLLPIEYALLEFFMRHQGTVFSARQLLSSVWKSDADATEIAVRSTITRLRRKIDIPNNPSYIETIFGFGYRLGGETEAP